MILTLICTISWGLDYVHKEEPGLEIFSQHDGLLWIN